jgi:hypothetical protein
MFVLRELSEANGGDIYNIDFPIEDGITIAKGMEANARLFKSLVLIARAIDTMKVSNTTIKRSQRYCLNAKWRRVSCKHRAYFKSNLAESPTNSLGDLIVSNTLLPHYR